MIVSLSGLAWFLISIAFAFMTRTWKWPTFYLLCGSALAAVQISSGTLVLAAVVLAVFVLLAGVHSPLVFPRPLGATEAQRRSAADGRPVVFWRSGCKYCIRLRLRLGRRARQAYWVDIWRDPEGAAVVRAANDGDETVPTVFVAGRPHVNPDPEWVREQLSRTE